MQIICKSFQTDNHASTPPFSFLQAGCPSCYPTNSKALKAYCKHKWSITECSRHGMICFMCVCSYKAQWGQRVSWVTALTGMAWHITWTRFSSVWHRCFVSMNSLYVSLSDSCPRQDRLSADIPCTTARTPSMAEMTWSVHLHWSIIRQHHTASCCLLLSMFHGLCVFLSVSYIH